MLKRFLLGVALLLLGLAAAVSAAGSRPEITPGQILVKFVPGSPAAAVAETHRAAGGTAIRTIPGIEVQVVKVPSGKETAAVARYAMNPNVEYAEPDYVAEAVLIPNDEYFGNQWGLHNTGQTIVGTAGVPDADIDAPEAWEVTAGGVKVAILDSGIDQDHPDLSSQIVANQNFTTSNTVDDRYGHGTHVGGIVAAVTNNTVGVASGCPACTLMNVKVLGDSGSGAYSWVSQGIIWAADNGAKVINMSLGGSQKSRTLEGAVNYAWSKGAVLAAAAGNSNTQAKLYPAAYARVIAVAATNNQDRKAGFSSYGAKWVDVAAPGENIFSTFPNHPFVIGTEHGRSQNYDFGSGTSMATPMVSAAAALIWSAPYGTSASSVRSRLEATADAIPGTGTYWAKGRINAARAVGAM